MVFGYWAHEALFWAKVEVVERHGKSEGQLVYCLFLLQKLLNEHSESGSGRSHTLLTPYYTFFHNTQYIV